LRDTPRVARTSRAVSALAILGLIVSSMLIVLILNSSSLANPVMLFQGGPLNPNPGPQGTLGVRLLSNQNQSEMFANPSPESAGWPFPVVGKSITVSQGSGSLINPFSEVLTTDSGGFTSVLLSPGQYVVNLRYETLNITIPFVIAAGRQTTVFVNVSEMAYPLAYSEESGARPTMGGTQSEVYAELRASAPVAGVSDPVILEVHRTGGASGYLVNATVLSRQSPTQGIQWLELGAAGTVDPVNATSIVLTTWTYSALTKMQAGPSVVF
jgi:hypothetical protein